MSDSETPQASSEGPAPSKRPDAFARLTTQRADEELITPEGTHYERQRRERPRRLGRRIRGFFSRIGVNLVAWGFPFLYIAYCWLVKVTSRVELDTYSEELNTALDRYGRFVGVLWHQEVFTVAYFYGEFKAHTLASTGNFGQIIASMLERCGYTVFRGGSSTGRARRRRVLPSMIHHMREHAHERVFYGITVDGSKGPPLELKSGALVIARSCGVPVYLCRLQTGRRFEAKTWDRTAIPLPFGRIKARLIGPFWIPPDCSSKDMEGYRAHIQHELLELKEMLHVEVDGKPDRRSFPEDFEPRWKAGEVEGVPYGPYDLQVEPPPWFVKCGDPKKGVAESTETESEGATIESESEGSTTESEGATAETEGPTAETEGPTTESESEGPTSESESEGPTAETEGATTETEGPTTESEGPTTESESEGPTTETESEGPTTVSESETEGPTTESEASDAKVQS